MISFVLFPQASQPCMNFNISELVYSFRIRILLFLSDSFGIETTNTFIHSCSFLETQTLFQTKMGKIYTRFQTETASKVKTLHFGAAHTYMADIMEYPLFALITDVFFFVKRSSVHS